ncbi:MAG TPA: NTP transferase domain-containing protein [Acidimicrobiales bacterium]|nr:NTP transferase domain-containing protein [Acidimicrobiales bacterium]
MLSCVVLAAGAGTRMHSARPKPLHRLCGRPMLVHTLEMLAALGSGRTVVVVGHGAEAVTKVLVDRAPAGLALDVVHQTVRRGTGHALMAALPALAGDETGAPTGGTTTARSWSCPATPPCCAPPLWPPWWRPTAARVRRPRC